MRNDAQSILERFKEREREIKSDADKLDKEMSKKRVEYEKRQLEALGKLETARADLGRMKADYLKLEGELGAEALVAIEARAITAESVKAGTATMAEYVNAGMSGAKIKKQAADETAAKLAGARQIILDKQLEIFKLEAAEAEARENMIYCSCYPGMTQVQKLKAEVEVLERTVAVVNSGYYQATSEKDRAQLAVALSEGKSVSGHVWNELTFDELKAMRFDPRICPKYSAELEGFIGGASPNARFNVFLRVAAFGNTPGLNVNEAIR